MPAFAVVAAVIAASSVALEAELIAGGNLGMTANTVDLGYSSLVAGDSINITAGSVDIFDSNLASGGYGYLDIQEIPSSPVEGNINILSTAGSVDIGYSSLYTAYDNGQVSITAKGGGTVDLLDSSIGGGEGVLIGATGISLDNSWIGTGYAPTANVEMVISGGALILNNGSAIEAGNDVILTLTGANARVVLNETSGMAPSIILSDFSSGVPETTHINFLGRTAGGVVIDGVETTTTAYGGSGFFVLDPYTPASLNNGLEIVYSGSSSNIASQVIDRYFAEQTDSTSTTKDDEKKKGDDTSNEGDDQNEQKDSNVGQCV